MIKWIKKIFKKDNWTIINDGEQKTVISPEVTEFFNSKLPSPDPMDLKKIIEEAKKIIVSERIVSVGRDELIPLIIVNDMEQIKMLGQKLNILSEPGGHLLDGGHYMFDIVTKNSKHRIEYMGDVEIRWKEKWKEDAILKDHIGLLEWFKEVGIEKPLNEYKRIKEEQEKRILRYERWKSVAPKSIVESIDNLYQNDFDRIYEELNKEVPNERELILKLFQLYGYEFGIWNGFPSYESIPEEILLKFSFDSLVSVTNNELTEEQKHGIARFFTSYGFTKTRIEEIHKLPLRLKNILLEHLTKFGDDEKTGYFRGVVSYLDS